MRITKVNGTYRNQINAIVERDWAGPYIVTRGNLVDTRQLPGFVCLQKNEMAGYVLYQISGNECEIIILHSLKENIGAGSALINAVLDEARRINSPRVWLITTNDNTHAIRYYQKRGFSLKAVHIGSMLKTRELKPEIPERGIDGIPLLHEFEFEILL